MDSINNHCSNCQLLEKKILETNSSVKKLLSLKSKIINTDTLIRKYKEQKDEAERLQADKQQLIEEREKSERLCTKYEIDLKLALEEVHTLRQCEKEYKTTASRFETEITSLRDSLQAEKVLVKQYKSLAEKDEKAEEHTKDKAVREFEKKLSKKEDELQKSREKTRGLNKELSLVSKSHMKALKFIKKIGNHPALQGILPAGDKRILNNFCDALLNKTTNDNQSEDEDDEFLDESQYLENLLLDPDPSENNSQDVLIESVPNGHSLETEIPSVMPTTKHIQHAALDSTTDVTNLKKGSSEKSVVDQPATENHIDILGDNVERTIKSAVVNPEANHLQCDSPDSTSPVDNLLCARNMPVLPIRNVKVDHMPTKRNDQNLTSVSIAKLQNHLKFSADVTPVVSQPVETLEETSMDLAEKPSKHINTSMSSIQFHDSSSLIHLVDNHNKELTVPVDNHNDQSTVPINVTDSNNIAFNENGVSSDLVTPVGVKENLKEDSATINNSDSVQYNSTLSSPMEVEQYANNLSNQNMSDTLAVPDEVRLEVSQVLNCVVSTASELVSDLKPSAGKELKETASNTCENDFPSEHTDLDSKDDVNMSNAESEYEEGELVIASDCEQNVVGETTDGNLIGAIPDTPESPDKSEDRYPVVVPIIPNAKVFKQATSNVGIKESTVSENSTTVHRSSTEFTLPLIPFSEDRQFRPANQTSKSTADAASLFKDSVNEASNVDQNDGTFSNKSGKSKRNKKKVDKICSRMKNAVVLDCPVSPLPPSPPSTPLETTFSKSIPSEINRDNEDLPPKERCESISELFGSDSEDESLSQMSKSILQHQESEGFDPDPEHLDDRTNDVFNKQDSPNRREILRRVGHRSRELQLLNNSLSDRSSGDENVSCREPRNMQVSQLPNQLEASTRLFTDFSMDPGTGRCKISIRLPETMKSAANVRFELDTLSKQIHLDYGPSQFNDWKNCRQTHSSRNVNNSYSNSSEFCCPKVTMPDDTPQQTRPAISPPNRCTIEEETHSSNYKNSKSPFSHSKGVRRASVPPIGNALQRLSAQRRVVTFDESQNEPIHSGSVKHSEKNVSSALFKTPALRKQNACITFKSPGNKTPESITPNTSTQNLTTEMNLGSKEMVASQTAAKNSSNSSSENNASLQMDSTVPKTRKGKRKHKSPARPNDNPKKLPGAASDLPSDLSAQRNMNFVPPLQLPADPNIINVLRMLKEVKWSDESNNNLIFTKIFKSLCNAGLCPTPDDLVTASLVYFSSCPLNLLICFSKKKDPQSPLLTVREEVFVALIKHLQEKQARLANAINHFLAGVSAQLNQALDAAPTGLASLCRLHTVLCRQEGYVQMSQDLCYHLVLRKHPHAAFLVANVLVVWPTVLELSCSPAHWNLRKKIFSLFLLGNQSDADELTTTVLNDLGQMHYSQEDCVPDSLAMEMVNLLAQNCDLRGNEDICQQLLLLSYMQGWPWAKESVLPHVLGIFETASGNTRAPVIRLVGSFLHYCGPKAKEESDFLVQKLETKFKDLDDNDFLSKEACTHSLLSLASQLDHSTVSQMKLWLQNHRDRLSPHLREDFVNSGFLRCTPGF